MVAQANNPCPPISPYVAQTLDALRADGIAPTDEQIAWLVRLRVDCDRPAFDKLRPPLGAPLTICDLEWWPLHPRAERWFIRAGELLGDEWKARVYMYAHLFSAPGDRSLDVLTGPDEIMQIVGEWRSSLPLHDESEAELVRLLKILDGYGDNDSVPDDRKDKQPASELAGIGMLCKTFPGTTPEYWRSGISGAETDELLQCQECGKWATSRQREEAIRNYLRAVKWIRRAHGQLC